jgi:hypothetical protein
VVEPAAAAAVVAVVAAVPPARGGSSCRGDAFRYLDIGIHLDSRWAGPPESV